MQLIKTLKRKAFFDARATLDDREYTLQFQWNQRDGWYLGMLDANGNTLFSPRKLVLDWDILRSLRWNDAVPQGSLIAVDLESSGVKPGYLELATSLSSDDGRVLVVYFTEAERLASLGA